MGVERGPGNSTVLREMDRNSNSTKVSSSRPTKPSKSSPPRKTAGGRRQRTSVGGSETAHASHRGEGTVLPLIMAKVVPQPNTTPHVARIPNAGKQGGVADLDVLLKEAKEVSSRRVGGKRTHVSRHEGSSSSSSSSSNSSSGNGSEDRRQGQGLIERQTDLSQQNSRVMKMVALERQEGNRKLAALEQRRQSERRDWEKEKQLLEVQHAMELKKRMKQIDSMRVALQGKEAQSDKLLVDSIAQLRQKQDSEIKKAVDDSLLDKNEELVLLQSHIEQMELRMITSVAEGRKATTDKLRGEYEAKITAAEERSLARVEEAEARCVNVKKNAETSIRYLEEEAARTMEAIISKERGQWGAEKETLVAQIAALETKLLETKQHFAPELKSKEERAAKSEQQVDTLKQRFESTKLAHTKELKKTQNVLRANLEAGVQDRLDEQKRELEEQARTARLELQQKVREMEMEVKSKELELQEAMDMVQIQREQLAVMGALDDEEGKGSKEGNGSEHGAFGFARKDRQDGRGEGSNGSRRSSAAEVDDEAEYQEYRKMYEEEQRFAKQAAAEVSEVAEVAELENDEDNYDDDDEDEEEEVIEFDEDCGKEKEPEPAKSASTSTSMSTAQKSGRGRGPRRLFSAKRKKGKSAGSAAGAGAGTPAPPSQPATWDDAELF